MYSRLGIYIRRVFRTMAVAILLVTMQLGLKQEVEAAGTLQVTDSGSEVVVDTGAGLRYVIEKTAGSMTSTIMNGKELTAWGKTSQINSGLGSAQVNWQTFDNGGTVLIAVKSNYFDLTHYYASRSGDNNIYMATYVGDTYPSYETRFIFRGNSDILTNMQLHSNNSGSTGAIESSDVFGHANGYTTSKYYGNDQAKDLGIRGVTGNGVGVFVAYGDREKSSGGPFFRDIQFQDAEVYNYMFSAHNQTESSMRKGLHGPYAYMFTTGGTPSKPNFNWMSNLNLQGWQSNRGKVVLNGLAGMNANYNYTIGFANDSAQYWTPANSRGSAVRDNMIPGTYTMTVYKGELKVHSEIVNVNAGSVTTLNTITINGDPSNKNAIWRIGEWDGTPNEFKNGQNISKYHPSDVRNEDWGPQEFSVGSFPSQFPAIQTRGENSPMTITFNLNAVQASSSHELNIGITAAYNNGRPAININGHDLRNPSASSQPQSRSFTIGTYRGNNSTFSWTIPASYLVEGTNTFTIYPISGSSDLTPWLSAGWVYDTLEILN